MATHTSVPSQTPRSDAAPVPIPASHGDALAIARRVADRVRPGAVERDRNPRLPVEELEAFRATGLLTLPVPERDGGPGASHRTLTRVFAIVSAADPAFLQVVQPHFSFVDLVGRYGSDELRALLLGEVLRGARVGNALSERGRKHAFDFATRLADRPGGGHVLTGKKYYSTGAPGADWVAVFALDAAGEPAVAYVPGDAEGLRVEHDWAAFGQRATISGTTVLDDVLVPEGRVIRGFVNDGGVATTVGAYANVLHAAIDVGIARGALEDGIAFTRDRARAWPAANVERAVDEPHVQSLFGRLTTLVEASEELLDKAARLLDEARDHRTEETVGLARLGVAKAKAFAGDVVLETTSAIFEAAGSSGADSAHGLDRHWRNARTHTLHDPNRWKYIHTGRHVLDGQLPPIDDHSL